MTIEDAIEIIKSRNFYCIECIDRNEECCKALDMAIKALTEEPAVERPTAEWILLDEDKNAYECSNCKEPFILFADTPKENNYNYCPNCGRKMKGAEL